MKKGRLFLSLAWLVSIMAMPVFAQDGVVRLESIVVDTFDDPTTRTWTERGTTYSEPREWVVTGSRYSTVEGDIKYPRLAYIEGDGSYPLILFGTNPGKLTLRSLGVFSKFDKKGYNYFEIYPVKTDEKGVKVPAPMTLPGLTKSIDLWVWGSNYRVSLEIHVRDFRGIPYVLNAGSLRFQGWNNVRVNVPDSIPQVQSYLPRYKGITLTKLVVRYDPNERVDGFFTYFDQLSVQTDLNQTVFDGQGLLDSKVVNKYFTKPSSNVEAANSNATAVPAQGTSPAQTTGDGN